MLTDLRPERAEACLSDLTFDAWRAGELGAAEASAAESHISGCTRCQERRRELDGQAAAFLERFPVLAVPAKPSVTRAPRAAQRRPAANSIAAWAGLALAASVVLFLGVHSERGADEEGGTRLKGSERIGFVVRRGERVFDGADGEHVRPGDQLRFVVRTRAPRHLAILSRDAAGVTSVYYPSTGTHARLVAPSEAFPLESAVELDDTLGREQLYAVFCDGPFELEPLRAKLERDAKLAAPPGCRLDVLELVKDRAR